MTEPSISQAEDESVYKTLLESTRAIPWKIDWATMQFVYIGPQIEPLLGWAQDSWISVEDWATRMHPEDQEWVVNFCVSQSKSGVDHEADYRALHKDGHYVWIRDVVHVVRNAEGGVEALVGFMFDISERKKTEQELAALQKKLEEYSFRDGLTGLANRRMFDTVMEESWHNALRHRQPLSALLIDIDHFKQYNDAHGHLKGDECLKEVASLLQSSALRAKDFVARFGGEEFIMVLPETEMSAALKVAERCQQCLLERQLEHGSELNCAPVTISIGVGTVVPTRTDNLQDFLKLIDGRLYEAKKQGRDQIVSDPSKGSPAGAA